MLDQEAFEEMLANGTGRDVKISNDVYYSEDGFVPFRKLFVDGKEIHFCVNINGLQTALIGGRLRDEVEKVCKALSSFLESQTR